MFTLHTMLADTVVISGNAFGWHFVVTLSQLIYWAVAAVIGLIAETIVGWRLPLGVVGAVAAALIGIWLLTAVIHVSIPGEINFYGVPLFKTLIGAIIMVALWHLVTYRSWAHRRRLREAV